MSRFQFFEPASVEEARVFIEQASETGWRQFGIRVEGGSALAGDIGFRQSGELPQAKIGVTVAPRYQRQGLAAEAVGALLEHLFGELGIHRVYASVDTRNVASRALFTRMGMRQEAHLRQSVWFKGEWADDVVFGMLRAEWRPPA